MGGNRREKNSCGGKERTMAIISAGRLNIEGFFIAAKVPPSCTSIPAPENKTCKVVGRAQHFRGYKHDSFSPQEFSS